MSSKRGQQQVGSPNSTIMDLRRYSKENRESGGVRRKTSSSLTFSRGWLKHVALETLSVGEKGFYTNNKGEQVSVKEDLRKAADGSVHYHSTHEFTLPETPGDFATQFIIAYGSSLDISAALQSEEGDESKHDDVKSTDKTAAAAATATATATAAAAAAAAAATTSSPREHVGVLNSASAKTPSKFLRGTISQEEGFCRASLLYHCLLKFEHLPHHFYFINNKEKYRSNASACAIFSPLVPVIRQDSVQGELLDHYKLCSFVSIPAVNAFVVGRQEHEQNIPMAQQPGACEAGVPHENITLWQAMYDRISRALLILQQHGCTQVVLCAFGCGVHGNNPETVAKIFRKLLLETNLQSHFRTVVFAIQPSRTANYNAFQKVFPEATAL